MRLDNNLLEDLVIHAIKLNAGLPTSAQKLPATIVEEMVDALRKLTEATCPGPIAGSRSKGSGASKR